MRKALTLMFATFLLLGSLTGCKRNKETIDVDYENAAVYEQALNDGEDTTGKTVKFIVDSIHTGGLYPYDIWAGEHLNFISEEDPKVKNGKEITVKITDVESFLGSWIIKYEILD